MKTWFISLFILILSFTNVLAEIEDNSIINELEKTQIKQLEYDFKLKTFNSCENLEDVMWKYIKNYWKNYKNILYRRILFKTFNNTQNDSWVKSTNELKQYSQVENNFSKINTQVDWVDESDIIKTDGKYIYYYNEKDKYVYIVEVKSLKIIKKNKNSFKFFATSFIYLKK